MSAFRHLPVEANGAHFVFSSDAGRTICVATSELDAKMIAAACEEQRARLMSEAVHSTTPATDAAEMKALIDYNGVPHKMVHASFSRRLERERNEAQALLVKCFNHLSADLQMQTLNESAQSGVQSLHAEIARLLDSHRIKP